MSKEIDKLEERVSLLQRELYLIQGELKRLKGGAPQPVPPPVAEPLLSVEAKELPEPEVPQPVATPVVTPEHRHTPSFFEELFSSPEKIFGVKNLFGVLGVISVVFAVGWFIGLALEKRWLNQSARLFTGVIAGYLVIFGSSVLRKKVSRSLGSVLLGGGAGVVYLTLWGAYYYYGYLGIEETFVYLGLLVLWTIAVSVYYGSEGLFTLAFLGAFIAPILLSTGENSYRFLFSYLFLLNLSYPLVSLRHDWKKGGVLVLFANYLVFSLWAADKLEVSTFTAPFLFLLSLFVVFTGRELFLAPRREGELGGWSLSVLALQGILFTSMAIWVFSVFYPDYYYLLFTGLALMVGSFFYIGQHPVSRFRFLKWPTRPGKWDSLFLFVVIVVAAVASLFSFSEGPWGAAGFITLGGTLLVSGIRLKVSFLRFASLFLVWVLIYILVVYGSFDMERTPFWNSRFALMALLDTAVAASLWAEYRVIRKDDLLLHILQVALVALLYLAIAFEVHDLVGDDDLRNFSYSMLLVLFAAASFWGGFLKDRKGLRIAGIFILVLLVPKAVYDSFNLDTLYTVIEFTILGVGMIAVNIVYHKIKHRIGWDGGVDV